jgi:sulfur carrier protein ThiS adenylyltransferase
MNQDIFERNVPGLTERLKGCCIGIAGCGGLGSNVAVALTRAGIGKLILADFDRVEPSNLNRQHFFLSDIGKYKADALGHHLRAINPSVHLDIQNVRLSPDNLKTQFQNADMLVEAFDLADSKSWLIRSWCRCFPDRYIIAGNGVAGYGASGKLHIEQAGRIIFCGDMQTDMDIGLSAPRVLLVAAMQANAVLELIMEGKVS